MLIHSLNRWETGVGDELARRWDEYVDCKRRLKREGPFLKAVLACAPPKGIVLDAAMGLGCEVLYLASEGSRVIGNELDERMYNYASEAIARAGLTVQTARVDWRGLVEAFEPGCFAAVLIVGNSLSLLPAAEDRAQVCKQVFSLLKPGGVFIVDQRNYEYMLQDRRAILEGAFKYSADTMYCERGIVGRPTSIEDGCVRLTCFDKQRGYELGHFDLHPFRSGELPSLLDRAGFRTVKTFRDFSDKPRAHWDFETFVGIR